VTALNPTHRLGRYQREVAKHLTQLPMSTSDAVSYVGGNDHGYAAMTLIRLEERGIAKEWSEEARYVYCRGPRWAEAAEYYGWEI
jgi:hypothetical protein